MSSYAFGGDPPGLGGKYHFGVGSVGIPGSTLSTESYLYPSISRPADDNKEYYAVLGAIPGGLTFDDGEAGDFEASANDGQYAIALDIYEWGVLLSPQVTLTLKFGNVSTVNLAISNLASASTLSTGAATVTPAGAPGVRNLTIANLATNSTLSTGVVNVSPAYVPPYVPVSDDDFIAWLDSDDAIPNVLVETFALVGGVLTPFFWSTCGYTTEGTVATTHYAPVISTSIPFRAALSIAGGASVGASTLDVDNTDGINEILTTYDFDDQLVSEYFGDLRWHRADYRRVFKGVSAGLVRKDVRSLALRLRDMTHWLDVPMSEHKLGGTSANQDQIIPLAFGEVENVSGLMTNPGATLERAFHDGPIKGFGEVRAAGLPVPVTVHLDTGRCEPTEDNGSAVITVSIQGDNYGGVFRKTIASVIRRVITGFGPVDGRLTDSDIDLANFANFDVAHQATIGYNVVASEQVAAVCDFLARSVGAQLVPTSDGQLRLIQIALPASGTSMDIRAEHLAGPLRPVQHIDAVTAVKLGFCRNYTVQETVAGGVPAELAELFKTEWLTATAGQGDPEQRNTALMRRADAQAEADRELALWGPGRDIFEFDGLAPLLMLKLGQPVTVYDELNGMAAGKPGQILELTPDYDNRRITGRILV